MAQQPTITPNQLTDFLLRNPRATLAYSNKRTIHIHLLPPGPDAQPLDLEPIRDANKVIHPAQPIRPLWLLQRRGHTYSDYTACQNEPIRLGTQIQPRNAPWVGTAGAPCAWPGPDKATRWGFLTNWHVAHGGIGSDRHPIHQPTDAQGIIGYRDEFAQPTPAGVNTIDACLVDCFVQGKHTIAWSILGEDTFSPEPRNATVGQGAFKTGRTTGLTEGACVAVGASARVDYGDFTAVFQDQDVFEGTRQLFGDAGDSGSMILCACNRGPMSLLFAGSGRTTLGNPIRHVIAALNLSFAP